MSNENDNDQRPSINVLTFWGTLCGMINKNDIEGFKKLIDTDYSSIDSDKYKKAMFMIKDEYEFLHHLIIVGGVKRTDVDPSDINPSSEKLFLLQELMEEAANNPQKKNKPKV
jgi:hypothetical protein